MRYVFVLILCALTYPKSSIFAPHLIPHFSASFESYFYFAFGNNPDRREENKKRETEGNGGENLKILNYFLISRIPGFSQIRRGTDTKVRILRILFFRYGFDENWENLVEKWKIIFVDRPQFAALPIVIEAAGRGRLYRGRDREV